MVWVNYHFLTFSTLRKLDCTLLYPESLSPEYLHLSLIFYGVFPADCQECLFSEVARPTGPAGFCFIAITGPGILVRNPERKTFFQDICLGHTDKWGKKSDLCCVLCSEINNFLECLDELRSAVRISAVIEGLDAYEDGGENLGPNSPGYIP